MLTVARTRMGSGTCTSPSPRSSAAITPGTLFIAIHGQCAQLWHVAPLPAVGASISVLPGASCRIRWKIPRSVATMYSSASPSTTACSSWDVEPTMSAWRTTVAGDSGWATTRAPGWSLRSRPSSRPRNSSWTMHAPRQSSMSAPVSRRMYSPRWRSGAHRIRSPRSARCRTIASAHDEVTVQSARALIAALVFA